MTTSRAMLLVATNTPDHFFSLKKIFKARGYGIIRAKQGEPILAEAVLTQPDLILLEVGPTNPNVYEVCHCLKATPQTQAIPIILIATPDSPFDRERGLAVGAADYALFPDDSQALLARIETQLSLGRLQQALSQTERQLENAVLNYTEALLQADLRLQAEVTSRRRTEEALYEQLEFRRAIIERAADGLCVCHETPEYPYIHFTVWNQRMTEITGYSLDQINRQGWYQSVYPDPELQSRAARLTQMRQDEDLVAEEWEITRADGGKRTLRISTSTLSSGGNETHILALMQDITEQKQAEEALHRRNRELTLLNRLITASVAGSEPETILALACRELAFTFDLTGVSASLLNEQGTEITIVAEYFTGGASSLLNQSFSVQAAAILQEIAARPVPLLLENPADDPRVTPLQPLLRQRGLQSLLILPLVVENNCVGALQLGCTRSRTYSPEEIDLAWNVAGQVAGSLARFRLTRTHDRLLTAIEQSPESVVITDKAGNILYVNPAFEQTTGYSREEALGQNPRLLKSYRQDSSFYRQLWDTISRGEIWRGRFINQKKDGSLFTEEAIITPVRDNHGNVVNYVALKRDVTRELQLEEEYRQSQKMEAIGRLAGGVAHDFNNLLTAIMGYTGMALQALNADDPLQADIEGIQKAAERAANLTRQLLAFARKQVIHPVALNLNDLILHLSKMLRRLIGEDVELVILPGSDLAQIKADPNQIEQVILNLVINARDAMPKGGKLTLTTANVTLHEAEVQSYAQLAPGQYVKFTLEDTGGGMSAEVKKHIFEPFFTTKAEGKGTGLGLATVFGIVKQNQGHVWCDSELGRGTIFIIYLPALAQTENSPVALDNRLHLPRGTETILLVEDETAVRALVARMLRDHGYTLLEATNGSEALTLAQEYGQEIDLLLTDIVMPGLSGKLLAERLCLLQPRLKVLFISGYSDEIIFHHGLLEQEIQFLQKPFTRGTLIRQVRQVLDNPIPPEKILL